MVKLDENLRVQDRALRRPSFAEWVVARLVLSVMAGALGYCAGDGILIWFSDDPYAHSIADGFSMILALPIMAITGLAIVAICVGFVRWAVEAAFAEPVRPKKPTIEEL